MEKQAELYAAEVEAVDGQDPGWQVCSNAAEEWCQRAEAAVAAPAKTTPRRDTSAGAARERLVLLLEIAACGFEVKADTLASGLLGLSGRR